MTAVREDRPLLLSGVSIFPHIFVPTVLRRPPAAATALSVTAHRDCQRVPHRFHSPTDVSEINTWSQRMFVRLLVTFLSFIQNNIECGAKTDNSDKFCSRMSLVNFILNF